MSVENRPDQALPELHVPKEGPRCGKFVGKDGDRDLYCDLPEGHSEPACSAPVKDADL